MTAASLLIGLLVYEKVGHIGGKIATKVPLSALFVLVAVLQPYSRPAYYWLMLTGLLFCLVGDVCLISARRSFFLAGLIAFLAGHLWFTAAFYMAAGLTLGAAIGALVFLTMGSVIYRWLRTYLEHSMKGPVTAYIIVISLMLSLAVSLFGDQSLAFGFRLTVIAGAFAFYLSDIFVARNRFITKAYQNRLIGLPLYYTGQFLLAFSIGLS